MKRPVRLVAVALAASALVLAACSGGNDGRPIIGLITKTDTNPFFVTMKKGAQEQATKDGIDLRTFAGRIDGDNESQVTAIENLMALGAEGFMITPNDSRAIVPAIERAKEAGLAVIALDTQLDPADAADSTYATDNFEAGRLVGEWARAKVGEDARIAFLDLTPDQVSVDVQRDQGFMEGFGIDTGDPNRIGDEDDPRISGHDVTDGAAEGGRTGDGEPAAARPRHHPRLTINESAAAGAYEALKAAGKAETVTLVSVDGGCPGVQSVKDGQLGATSQQYPLKMAASGVTAIAEFEKTGQKPGNPGGQDFTDTGVTLITDDPQPGVDSEDTTFGTENCWG